MGFLDRFGRQPGSRPAEALVASAKILELDDDQERQRVRRGALDWQRQTWHYFETLPEIANAATMHASAMSRLNIVPAVRPDPRSAPVPLSPEGEKVDGIEGVDDNVREAMHATVDRLVGGSMPGHELMRLLDLNIFLTGDCYLLGYNDPEYGGEVWEVASVEEFVVSPDGRGYGLRRSDESGPLVTEPLPPNTWAIRIWTRHPRMASWAWSSMRAALRPCEELEALGNAVMAAAASRLSAPFWFLPHGMRGQGPLDQTMTGQPDEAQMDPLVQSITRHFEAPKKNPRSAAGVVPGMMFADREDIQAFKDVLALRDIDHEAAAQRVECIERIATALDMPVEALQGKSGMNHWGAALIDEEGIKYHFEPSAMQLMGALTTGYFRPHLAKMGIPDLDRYFMWYDATDLVAHPNQEKNYLDGFDRFAVSFAGLRRQLGIPEEDAPDDAEIAIRTYLEIVQHFRPKGDLPTPEQILAGEIPVLEQAPGATDQTTPIHPDGSGIPQPGTSAPGRPAPANTAPPGGAPTGVPTAPAAPTTQRAAVVCEGFAFNPDQPRDGHGRWDPGEHATHVAETQVRGSHGAGGQFASEDAATQYASQVLQKAGSPYADGVTVRFSNGDPNTSGTHFVSEGGSVVYPVIELGANMRDQLTVVHEATHVLGGPDRQGTSPLRGHGPEFASAFTDQLRGNGLGDHATAMTKALKAAAVPTALQLPSIGALTASSGLQPAGARLASIERQLRLRLWQACDDQMGRTLERAGNRLRSLSNRGGPTVRALIEDIPKDHPELVGKALGPDRIEALGTSTADLLHGAFDPLKAKWDAWVGRAQAQGLSTLDEHAPDGIPDDELLALQERQAQDRDEGWAVLSAALISLAAGLVYDPTTEAPAQGEWSDTSVPMGLITEALTTAGGGVSDDGGNGLLSAQTITDALATGGLTVTSYTWEVGDPDRPFEPHQALDGISISGPDDEQLSGAEDWIDAGSVGGVDGSYWESDHPGCQCLCVRDISAVDTPDEEPADA